MGSGRSGLARLLEADLQDYAVVLTDHDKIVAEALSGVEKARAALQGANGNLDRVLAQAEFNALQEHVKACEEAFVKGLMALAALAPRVGKANSAIHAFYQFGNDISRAVANSVVPRG